MICLLRDYFRVPWLWRSWWGKFLEILRGKALSLLGGDKELFARSSIREKFILLGNFFVAWLGIFAWHQVDPFVILVDVIGKDEHETCDEEVGDLIKHEVPVEGRCIRIWFVRAQVSHEDDHRGWGVAKEDDDL